MVLKEAIDILERYNKWRLGANIPMVESKKITEAINVVVEEYKSEKYAVCKD